MRGTNLVGKSNNNEDTLKGSDNVCMHIARKKGVKGKIAIAIFCFTNVTHNSCVAQC